MSELSKHELAIWEEMIRLYSKYNDEDIEHDGHIVWRVAGEAAKTLSLRYNCPLAFKLAQLMIDYFVARYYAANKSAA